MAVKVNAVFEGGGVKAIGLAGAVKAAEEHGIEFEGLAGTSSGAIVAAYLAAGYKADELREIIRKTRFSSFLKRGVLHRLKWLGPTFRLFVKKGLYSGDLLEEWVRTTLLKKGVRTFGDLGGRKLKIVASDISQGKLLVLPDDIEQYGIKPSRFEIARAVRMSTSIPYFFDPVVLRKPLQERKPGEPFRQQFIYIVDGGILSNYPLWIFDRETVRAGVSDWRRDAPRIMPTIGFNLVGRHERKAREIYGPLSMFQALFATMMEAHDERYIEKHNRFRSIKIPTLGVHTTDFDISEEKSMRLYEAGLRAGREFFSRWSPDAYQKLFVQYLRHLHAIGEKR
jgi:Predicted esterase of the alpha-beta hydrolase superfamily